MVTSPHISCLPPDRPSPALPPEPRRNSSPPRLPAPLAVRAGTPPTRQVMSAAATETSAARASQPSTGFHVVGSPGTEKTHDECPNRTRHLRVERSVARCVIEPHQSWARIAAAMRGSLVAQTAGSRRAELDVLRPVAPAGQRPCQRFGSANERAHSPRRAWLSLHRAISGCGDPVSHGDRASRPVQQALPRVPG